MSRSGLGDVSGEQWAEYLRQARLLNDAANTYRVNPFAAALAGAGFIRSMISSPDLAQWWMELITMSPTAFFERYGVHVEAVFALISRAGSA